MSYKSSQIKILYDTECPFCSNFVALSRLKKNVGDVVLVDARSNAPLCEEMKKKGFDLNEGMIVVDGENIYFGSDAMYFISIHSRLGLLWAPVRYLMRARPISKAIYPILKLFRRLSLYILGISTIK